MRAIASWSKRASREAIASTSSSSWSSAITRLTYPYCSARGPSRSSATRRISSARPRPTRRESLAIGPPPGTTPDADLELAEQRVLARGEPQVAGQHELASGAAGASPDRGDADHRRTGQPHEKIEPRVHSGRTDAQRHGLARVVLDVVVGQVEVGVGAVEDDDVEVRILLDQADELGELRDGRRGDRVDRRVVERHPAVAGATAVDAADASRTATTRRSPGRCWRGWRRWRSSRDHDAA